MTVPSCILHEIYMKFCVYVYNVYDGAKLSLHLQNQYNC